MKLIQSALILGAFLMSFTSNALSSPNPKFYVFICFGQSNMEGFPGIDEQDKGLSDERFKVMAAVDFAKMDRKKGNWYPAIPPLCRQYSGLCPLDYFGRAMVTSLPRDIQIGVVNVSVGGCKIELFDKDNYKDYTKDVPDWMKNTLKNYDDNPYGRLVEMGKLAQKDGVIKGILLHQGESNTNDKEWPTKVKKVYDNLIKDLDLKPEDVPLIAGELVNADQKGACASMNKIINELPKTIPNSHVVSSAGCPCHEDHIHFTTEGYRILGKRYAEKMLGIMGVKMKESK